MPRTIRPCSGRAEVVAETLHGIQVTKRCCWLHDNTKRLCDDPAPYLVMGTSYCREHAIIVLTGVN